MSIHPILLAVTLVVICMPSEAEELDVLTLKNGRHLEGQYDDLTQTLTFGGSIPGSVQVNPADIAKREKVTIADAPAPKVFIAGSDGFAKPADTRSAPATAANRAAEPPAPAPAAKGAVVDPVQAKRLASVRASKKAEVKRQLQSSIDYQKTYETSIAKMHAEQADLPGRIQALDGSISAARQDFSNAQSRYTNVQADYDYWHSYRYRNSAYNGASVSDARHQRDKAESKLKKLENEQDSLRKKQTALATQLPSENTKLRSSIDNQAKYAAQLEALELEEAAAP
ncbi:MAG: hypothetical protein H0V44_06370 [Planctomycetes bacterium]|nr:hypothetical protein [Planctomycetota bacterium]